MKFGVVVFPGSNCDQDMIYVLRDIMGQEVVELWHKDKDLKKCDFIEGMKERIDRHKDGSIKAKGHMMDGELEGYWEWFRLDGSKLRTGHFKSGKQVGEWTTYDATGKVVKVTNFPN